MLHRAVIWLVLVSFSKIVI